MDRPPASRSDLRYVHSGDPLSARTMNGIIDFVKGSAMPTGPGSYADQFGDTTRPPVGRFGTWVRCISDDFFPTYSIMEVYDGTFDNGNYLLRVRRATSAGRIYAGNERYQIQANSEGWVKLITPYDAVRVSANEPLSFLDYCNIAVGSTQLEYSIGGWFLAVTNGDNSIAGAPNITGIILQTIVPALVGKTTEPVSRGQFGNVEIWGPLIGDPPLTDWDGLKDTGNSVRAMFLFGAAPMPALWVGLINTSFMWTAYVMECPPVS